MDTKLIRKPLQVANLGVLTEENMLSDVKAILGYKVAETATLLQKLAGVLKELDIEPFDPAKVEAYKKEQAKAIATKRQRSYDYGTYTVTGRWKSTSIAKYEREVPGFALIRAAQLKKALNLADVPGEFFVEELVRSVQRRQPVRFPDPFMVLHSCGKKLYIDVWNEPKFEGRRTK